MQEPQRPAHDPGSYDRAYPVGQTEAFEPRAFETPPAQTRQFPPAHVSNPAPQPYVPGPQYAAHRPSAWQEPLAHEGGLPYGNPPVPPQPRPQQFIPQHLAPPQQFAPGPYPPHPQPQYQQPYMYPPQHIQQTVVMHNGRRVSHGLHLVLTLLTAGLWLPVWIILSIANS